MLLNCSVFFPSANHHHLISKSFFGHSLFWPHPFWPHPFWPHPFLVTPFLVTPFLVTPFLVTPFLATPFLVTPFLVTPFPTYPPPLLWGSPPLPFRSNPCTVRMATSRHDVYRALFFWEKKQSQPF